MNNQISPENVNFTKIIFENYFTMWESLHHHPRTTFYLLVYFSLFNCFFLVVENSAFTCQLRLLFMFLLCALCQMQQTQVFLKASRNYFWSFRLKEEMPMTHPEIILPKTKFYLISIDLTKLKDKCH